MLHTDQSTVAKWETEDREPTLANFVQIAELIGVAPEWLVFGYGMGPGETVMEWARRKGKGRGA